MYQGATEMTSTLDRVFEAVKAHSIQTLVEQGESLPDEGAYNTIIENSLIKMFDDILYDVVFYNTTMDDSKFDSTIELIEVDNLE
jgi:hypothetical protein